MSLVSRPKAFSEAALSEVKLYKTASAKVNATWVKMMRRVKMAQLKKEAAIFSQDFARDIDRKEILLQTYLREIDETIDQNAAATTSTLSDMNQLIEHHNAQCNEMIEQFKTEMYAAESKLSNFHQQKQ
jgi:hypothetical protein